MAVDSYLELFTTLFGWTFYGIVWNVLVSTGVVFLPFLGILIDHWQDSAEGGDANSAAGYSLRRMEIELFLALLVVVLAAQPATLTPLNAAALQYTPPPTLSEPTPRPATVRSPDSTYGTHGFTGSPSTVNLPVWWYAVLSLSAGFNQGVVAGLPSVSDLRTYEQQARLATITDPRLRREASDFFSDCYIPARSKFQRERPDTPAVNALLSTHGPDDPDWMGSQVYRRIPGYYDTLRSTRPVIGWPYHPARDTEYDPGDPPAWGKPVCRQWWEDRSRGLRAKLIDAADATAAGLSSLVVRLAPAWATDQQYDAVAKTVLANAPPSWSNQDLVIHHRSTTGLVGTVEESGQGRVGDRGGGGRFGPVFRHHDGAPAGVAHGAGPRAVGHVRPVAAGLGPFPLFPVYDDDRGAGHFHGQVLECAVVSGDVGGSESDHVHVS